MVIVEKDVQKRILKVILDNGGVANSSEIQKATGLNNGKVSSATKHLISRALVSKIRPTKKTFPLSPNSFKLNDRLIDKIKRLISEIGQDVKNNS